MGGESTPSRAVVQSAGYGYCLAAKHLKLDQSVCECYGVVRAEFRRLLSESATT